MNPDLLSGYDLGNFLPSDFSAGQAAALSVEPSLPMISPTATVASSTNAPTWGGFLSGLAGDASSILGGAVLNVTQSQAISRNQQLQAAGYTVPLSPSGLNGAINTSSMFLWAAIILGAYFLFKG